MNSACKSKFSISLHNFQIRPEFHGVLHVQLQELQSYRGGDMGGKARK